MASRLLERPLRTCGQRPVSLGTISSVLDRVTSRRASASERSSATDDRVAGARIVTPEDDLPSLSPEDVERTFEELQRELQVLPGGRERRPSPAKLVSPGGKAVKLPAHVFQALQFVVHHMARGDVINMVPGHKILSTQQAAHILNVSRPFVVKLLEDRAIPYTTIGTHRRVRMQDVLRYKEQRDRSMLDMLEELANEAQEAGDYFGG